MKTKQKKNAWGKWLVCFFIFSFFFGRSASAIFIDNWPDPDDIAGQLEERYHLNQESLQNQGENFNVSSQKGQAPQVLLFFSPSDPKPGVEMEARAFPEFFGNPTETLYFTWYLKRKECDLASDLSDNESDTKKKELCDFNDDNDITVEDWKIAAMQLIAAQNFDSTCALNGNLSDDERRDCARDMYNRDAASRINPSGRKGRDRDEDGYRATFGGDGRSGQSSYCYVHDFSDGHNYELPACKHLFPDNYYIEDDVIYRYPSDDERRQIGGTDDGFPIEQEHFWRTDPEDPSTAQNGNKDEANLAGLGQNTLKWTYAPEDKVGVVVEGVSMYNTKYDNASMMIMWALPRNKCDVKGKSSKTQNIKGYDVSIKTATTDVDDCLEDNLVDPTEGGQPENLGLSLSFTPAEPSAKLIPWDTSEASAEKMAQTADTLVINAASSNARQSSVSTNYAWRVQASSDGTFNTRFSDENTWVDITKDLETAKSIGQTRGNNISSISINLNLNKTEFYSQKFKTTVPGFEDYFKDDIAYFRISANATENFSGQASQSGSSSVVVKIVANKSIEVYDVDTVKDETSGFVRVRRNSTLFCTENIFQQTICPVLNNQIIGVNLSTSEGEIRDYVWTLDGNALACSSRVSSECADDRQGPVNFFPISGKVGDLYTLTVVANNAETGKSFTVSRRFQIVNPDFDLLSEDREIAWPKYLGKYTNLDGTESENHSKTSFEGIPGEVAKFSATFRPETLGTFVLNGIEAGDDQNEMIWSINGKPFKWNDTGLSLSLDGMPGDIYTVSLSGAYNQPRELRKALYDIWKISPFSSETVRFSKEIQVRLVVAEGGEGENARGKSNTFFASLISSVPPLVLFSVRLILSMSLILLVVGVAFSMMPEGKRGRSE